MRALYVDLDATLLGPDGALLRGGDKTFSLAGVRALEACHRAGAEVVLMSGRRQVTVAENARLFGQRAYIFEAGSCLVVDGEELWLTGDLMPGEQGSIHDQIEASGAPAMLLGEYAGRLEYHDPWHRGREVSHLFRGLVDARRSRRAARARGPRRAAARRQRRRAPPLARARRAERRARLPPRPARGLEGQRRRAPHAHRADRAARRDRRRRLARGPRDGGSRRGVLVRRERPAARPDAARGDRRAPQRPRRRRRPTGRASTRRSSRRSRSAAFR